MDKHDKIIIGSTAVIAASAIALFIISHQYDSAANGVQKELQDINYTLTKTREDVVKGNREIIEGNRILRRLIMNSVDDSTSTR